MRGRLLTAPYRRVACGFGLILIGCELLSAWLFAHLLVVACLQFVSGICVGILMGATSRYIATSKTPAQLFGFVDMTAVLLMSFMVFAIGQSVASNGLTGGYLSAAIICVVFFLALFCFRPQHQDAANQATMPTGQLGLSLRPLAIVSMGVLFITFSGLGFAFMFTMAANLDMAYEVASRNIGILLFASAFACQAGGWAAARFGPQRPLACAFVTCAIGWAVAIYTSNPTVFMLALIPAIFSLQFNFPILLSYCGALDNQGRWAAVASPLITSGFAWAAIVAGLIVNQIGLHALAWTTGAGMVICLFLLWLANSQSVSEKEISPRPMH